MYYNKMDSVYALDKTAAGLIEKTTEITEECIWH